MKLARKITLWFELGTLVLVGLYAWVELSEDLGAIHREQVTELSAVARAASIVPQGPGALADLAAEGIAVASVDAPSPDLASLRVGGQRVVEEDDTLTVYRRAPTTNAIVAVTKSTAELADVRRTAMLRTILVMAAIVVLGTLYASSIGGAIVGRPLRKLVARFRRVGGGDLASAPEERARRDEIGELSRELDTMVARLAEARDQAERDHAARLRAVEQLEHAERLATIGKLASGVAHELGTPLNTIGGYAKLIATKEETGDEAAACAKIVMEQVDRTAAIVRQLLDFARRGEPHLAPSDVRDCVERSLAVAGLVGKNAGVRVEYARPPAAQVAAIDDARLQQVIVNLVNNAIQASPRGERVTIETAASTDGVRIAVADRGHGIATADLAHVFEPFFTTKPVGTGTGLGLSVSYGIVQDHGGRIEVASELGSGATFTIVLPAAAAT